MKRLYLKNNKDGIIKNRSFFSKLCGDSPFLVISTPCGVGKYKFNKIGYNNNNEMILEYVLTNDSTYKDSNNILHSLGKYYYLSATQLLYAFKFYASS